MKLFILSVVCLMSMALAVDVKFSTLVSQNAVTDFNMRMRYKTDALTNFENYASCHLEENDCVGLTWDDGSVIQLTLDFPRQTNINKATEIGDLTLGNATSFEIEYCFETTFTKNRKWRKAKDVIQDDKRCPKKVVSKKAIPFGQTASFDYVIKSNMPGAHFFLTLYYFCNVDGEEDKDEFCGIDTTGPLGDLAKAKDIEKNEIPDGKSFLAAQDTSQQLTFRTTVIDSRPTIMVVMVIVMSIVSVSMLVLYFIYERVLKKDA